MGCARTKLRTASFGATALSAHSDSPKGEQDMARGAPFSRNAPRRRPYRPADSCTHFSTKSSRRCRLASTGATIRSCAKKSSASNGWSSTRAPWRPPSRSARSAGLRPLPRHAPAQQRKGAAGRLPLHREGRGRRPRASRPPRNGCSTTTTSSKSRSARSAKTCRRASTGSCPSSPPGRSPGFRACSASPGHSSRTPTAASSPRRCAASCAPIRRVEPLTIGELWAVAITLRIVLVENLRRVAQRIVTSRAARQEADAVADRLLGVNGQNVDPNALRAGAAQSPAARARVRRAARAPAARPGSEDHARAAVARRGARRAGHQLRTRWCRKSTSARAPRTSPCATSSPACGSCRTSTGRSSSRA